MDVKAIVSSPERALAALGISTAGFDEQPVVSLVEKISFLKEALKESRSEKGKISSRFREIEKGSLQHRNLLSEMREISERIKYQENQLKNTERELADLIKHYLEKKSAKPPLTVIKEVRYTGDFTIRELPVESWDEWFEFVKSQHSSVYHQRPWADIIQQSFGHRYRIWIAKTPEGKILGGMPIVFFDSKLFGRFAVSMPYFNYGGILSDWFNVAQAILEEMHRLCVQENLSHVEVRTMQANLANQVSTKKVSMILDLPATEQELESNIGSKVRAQYRKAEEHFPGIRFGKMELLNDFYHVFARNMRDLGTPVYSKRWFANILEDDQIQSWLVIVYIKKKPVSCGFLIGNKDMLEIPWASTIKAANSTNSNMWMYRKILGFAIQKGYRFFDFGRSTRDAGTYKFKKQWGAKPYTHYWYYLFPSDVSLPELTPDNPKYKLAISVWKLMPVWLTKIIGPSIVANIP